MLRKYLYYSAAACLIGLLATAFFQKINQDQSISIEKFANNSDQIVPNTDQNVRIVLGDAEIKLHDEDTNIVYSASGKISVGNHRKIKQVIKEKSKPIYNTLLVPFGKRAELRLADGTRVWVNSGSKLIYPVVFQGKKRQVYLSGEAIFNVTHNKNMPFQVISDNQKIEVLGTIFNVSTYPDEPNSTVLKQGSVFIKYKNEKSIHLKPGQMAEYNSSVDSLSSKFVNPDDYFSWREGFLSFKSSSLIVIINKLSRYYNVDIKLLDKSLKEETFSGQLDLKDDVDSVLKTISNTTNIHYVRKNNTIEILQS